MAEIGEPAEQPIHAPAPWREPKPVREPSPEVQPPVTVPTEEPEKVPA